MTGTVLCPHCNVIVERASHVLRCPQRDNNTSPHPTALPPATPIESGSLWVWQTASFAPPGWVLWGRVDRRSPEYRPLD